MDGPSSPDSVDNSADVFRDGVVEGFEGGRLDVDLCWGGDAEQLLDQVRIRGQPDVQEHVEAVLKEVHAVVPDLVDRAPV